MMIQKSPIVKNYPDFVEKKSRIIPLAYEIIPATLRIIVKSTEITGNNTKRIGNNSGLVYYS